jgi:hypothetical protein
MLIRLTWKFIGLLCDQKSTTETRGSKVPKRVFSISPPVLLKYFNLHINFIMIRTWRRQFITWRSPVSIYSNICCFLLRDWRLPRCTDLKVYRIALWSEINHRNKRFKGAKKGVFDISTGIAEILLNPYNMNMQSQFY